MIASDDPIRKALSSGRMAGSWLITGGSDYEKKQFVYEACSLLLNQDFRNVHAFHPDVKWLECGLTEEAKKEIQKDILAGKAVDDLSDFSRKREITVDDIRQGIQFLSLKGAPGGWRILVVSPADKMNENAANALLKELEEPGSGCVIFLLCQNSGKLLPTVKSRCRKIKLKPLSEKQLANELQKNYPTIEDIDLIVHLADGSLGLARTLCEHDGISLYRKMLSFWVPLDRLPIDEMKAFIADLDEDEVAFSLVKKLMLDRIYEQVRYFAVQSPYLAEDYMDLYHEIEALFVDIDRIYLDKKQVLESAFLKIAGVCHD